MQTFLVGGAVRDKWLNRPIKERDWVVVGSNATELSHQNRLLIEIKRPKVHYL